MVFDGSVTTIEVFEVVGGVLVVVLGDGIGTKVLVGVEIIEV